MISRRWRIALGVVGGAVLVLGGLGVWLLFGGEKPREVSEQEALDRLGSVPAGTLPAIGPVPGLYSYTGEGIEETSFPPLTESQGPEMPATVTAAGEEGCWLFRIDFNTHHWQEWMHCWSGSRLVERQGVAFSQRFFGEIQLDNKSVFVCEPPKVVFDTEMEVGDSSSNRCAGSGDLVPDETVIASTTTYLGIETIEIAGRQVDAVRVRDEGDYTGGQTGTETTDWWYDATTGLPLRNERRIELFTDTPVGSVNYTEDASFELTELTPRS